MKSISKGIFVLVFFGAVLSLFGCGKSENQTPVETFKGYVTTEDDFAAGNGQDTAEMIDMAKMAQSGLGITFQSGGKWKFYYFDGDFATKNAKGENGNWKFDGTDTQEQAWKIVESHVKNGQGSEPVAVTVTGSLTNKKKSNPGSDKDGKSFEIFAVKSIQASPAANGSVPSSIPDDSQASSSGMHAGMSTASQAASDDMSSSK